MRVLIADSDTTFTRAASHALRSDALAVKVVADAASALEQASATPYAALVVDLALPGARGEDFLKRLRLHGVAAPLLALTADARPEARVGALRAGADDCLVKPVLLTELVARVHALTRRVARKTGALFEVEDLVLHSDTRRAFRAGRALALTEREYLALEHLVRAHGRPVPANELLDLLWHEKTVPRDNFIAVLMGRLRRKVDVNAATCLLHTVRGRGYAVAGIAPRRFGVI